MPHKRAKQSIRIANREQRGYDAPPRKTDTSGDDIESGMSKTMVLNAERIRDARQAKLRARDDSEPPSKKRPKLVPALAEHESLRAFERRVEDEFRQELSTAFKSSRQAEGRENRKSKRKRVHEDGAERQTSSAISGKKEDQTSDWAKKPQRSRLNDVALEPPQLGRSARSAETRTSTAGQRLPLSLAQQAAIETERQRAIDRYRTLRDARHSRAAAEGR